MTTQTKDPQELIDLARHCHNGACNVYALIQDLSNLVHPEIWTDWQLDYEDSFSKVLQRSLSVKMIVGQISFLLGESLGPSEEVLKAWLELNVCSTCGNDGAFGRICPTCGKGSSS